MHRKQICIFLLKAFKVLCVIAVVSLLSGGLQSQTVNARNSDSSKNAIYPRDGMAVPVAIEHEIFLPAVFNPVRSTLGVNAPRFDEQIIFEETGVLWFGRVTTTENYADVRVGYRAAKLWVYVAVIDRLVWYDTTPTLEELPVWDAVSMYISINGNFGNHPDRRTYRFINQLNWSESRDAYQAVSQGDGTGWEWVTLPFTTTTDWQGNSPNDYGMDHGWVAIYDIPFSSLGLSGPPPEGAVWGLAFALHDRDDGAGEPIPDQIWPPVANFDQPRTWGQLRFGLPIFQPIAEVPVAGTTVIRHGVNGVPVADGMVGGSSICGGALDRWNEWGFANYTGADQVNVQNEGLISDWPCFSKFYITFPLDTLPKDKVINLARFTLHSIGNAGGGDWGDTDPSLVQVFVVDHDWQEASLNWNNAPLSRGNVSRIWVDPIDIWPGWPGVPRTWDLSYAVNEAYLSAEPLRLALYSADAGLHTGRYFSSSDVGDWDAIGRPTLEILWGDR